jgi:hypothetical protein
MAPACVDGRDEPGHDALAEAGDTYVVFAAFEALAGTAANFSDTAYESKADMSSTGQLFIDAPAGSFTTISGHDYSTDAGVNGVPEPSTWAMLLIGFAGLSFAARYRMARRRIDCGAEILVPGDPAGRMALAFPGLLRSARNDGYRSCGIA